MPGEEVTVHVNRDGPGTIEGPDAVESRGPLSLVVINHGAPAHVHCRLDGPLLSLAAIERSNVYVESETVVPVDVDPTDLDAPVTGTLEVSTRYGAETTAIDVALEPGPSPVDVDETLADPPRPAPDEETSAGGIASVGGVDPGTVAVLALAALAVAASLLAASILGGTLAVVAVLVVVVGLGVAGLLLVG